MKESTFIYLDFNLGLAIFFVKNKGKKCVRKMLSYDDDDEKLQVAEGTSLCIGRYIKDSSLSHPRYCDCHYLFWYLVSYYSWYYFILKLSCIVIISQLILGNKWGIYLSPEGVT